MLNVQIVILAVLCFVLLAYLQRDTFYVDRSDAIVYASHIPNLNTWLPEQWTQKNVATKGMEIVLTHLATNQTPSKQVTENHDSVLVVLDPYEYELKWKTKPKLTSISESPMGYFVALSSPSSAFKTECSYNLYGKTIAYLTESERLLIRAVLYAYRIPLTSVTLVQITQEDVLNLPKLLDKKFDVFITYVIPNSLYYAILRTLPLSLMGWQQIDMDRLRVYHPYVQRVSDLNLRNTFASPAPRALLMVMDREKDSDLLGLKLGLYLAYGTRPSMREGFITRLAFDEELDDPAYQCYGDLTVTKKDVCNSAYDVSGFPKASDQRTTWDRPCFADTECPFYKANKNYPNTRGGCIRGRCELPVGIYRKSYRHYSDKYPYTPLCYQCKDSANPDCCKEQQDRKKYPKLKSPDYAFANDKADRVRAKLPYFVSV